MTKNIEKTYNLDEHIERFGMGRRLRGDNFAQPLAMEAGDVLSDGRVIQRVEGIGESVYMIPSGGEIFFIDLRLPVQLKGETRGVLPQALKIGDIFMTGDVVLDDPIAINPYYTELLITGGSEGKKVITPRNVELAVYREVYPPEPTKRLGAFAIERVQELSVLLRDRLNDSVR